MYYFIEADFRVFFAVSSPSRSCAILNISTSTWLFFELILAFTNLCATNSLTLSCIRCDSLEQLTARAIYIQYVGPYILLRLQKL